jgi:DhnA family fructose-bisphosphate aldolase class Ia
MSKIRRLERIFREDGKSVIVAMDHGVTSGPVQGLVDPRITIKSVVDGGADAILATIGMAKQFPKELSRTGLIIRLDFPSSDICAGHNDCELLVSVEDAIRFGADAVIITAGPGENVERKTLANLTKVASECERYGIPFIAEMYPGGFNPPAEMINIENLKLAARMAADLGADMLKMPYRPGYEPVVEGCYGLPLVVLGGEKTNSTEGFLSGICDAMKAGSKGVAIGRNIWGAKCPTSMTKAIAAIVHKNASLAEAMDILNGVK